MPQWGFKCLKQDFMGTLPVINTFVWELEAAFCTADFAVNGESPISIFFFFFFPNCRVLDFNRTWTTNHFLKLRFQLWLLGGCKEEQKYRYDFDSVKSPNLSHKPSYRIKRAWGDWQQQDSKVLRFVWVSTVRMEKTCFGLSCVLLLSRSGWKGVNFK